MSNGPMGGGVSLDAGSLTALQQQLKMQEVQVKLQESQARLQEKMAGLQAEREERITEQVLTRAQLIRLDVLRALTITGNRPSTRAAEDFAQWVMSGAVKNEPLPGFDK